MTEKIFASWADVGGNLKPSLACFRKVPEDPATPNCAVVTVRVRHPNSSTGVIERAERLRLFREMDAVATELPATFTGGVSHSGGAWLVFYSAVAEGPLDAGIREALGRLGRKCNTIVAADPVWGTYRTLSRLGPFDSTNQWGELKPLLDAARLYGATPGKPVEVRELIRPTDHGDERQFLSALGEYPSLRVERGDSAPDDGFWIVGTEEFTPEALLVRTNIVASTGRRYGLEVDAVEIKVPGPTAEG